MYDEVIQSSISFIEQHLDEPLNLDIISQEAGFSKYHYHRLFKSAVGKSVTDYIRSRRLVRAAELLLYTDARILDIAMHCYFESQEAFTRSFKSEFALPPAQYRMQMKLMIRKKEESGIMSTIKGWMVTGTNPEMYQVELDGRVSHKGGNSVSLRSGEGQDVTTNHFATVMQQFQAEAYKGKRMRFTGFVKAEEVEGWSGLWMRIDDKQQNVIGFDNMERRAIKGTAEWNLYACVLDVPEEATAISIGILLSGKGKVWLDACGFEEVSLNVPVTSGEGDEEELPVEPQNLSFSQ